MVRAFRPDPVAPDALDRILDSARYAPSAGFTQGLDLVVLVGAADTARYWDVTLPAPRRATFPWPGLLAAPVLVVPCVRAEAYVERYSESDKARTGLGAGVEAWSVPYWFVDAGMATLAMLLRAVDEGLGACFFGIFEHEPAVRATLAIPDSHRPIGTVAIGHAAPDRPSRSVARGRRPLADIVHRGGW
jgi:nitroreductase